MTSIGYIRVEVRSNRRRPDSFNYLVCTMGVSPQQNENITLCLSLMWAFMLLIAFSHSIIFRERGMQKVDFCKIVFAFTQSKVHWLKTTSSNIGNWSPFHHKYFVVAKMGFKFERYYCLMAYLCDRNRNARKDGLDLATDSNNILHFRTVHFS